MRAERSPDRQQRAPVEAELRHVVMGIDKIVFAAAAPLGVV
jgi:hypothetical protein